MKKIFTLTLVLLAMAFAGNAQALLSENFENGALPTGWITVDADADGYTWEGSATTTSYFQSGTDLSGEGHNASNGYIMSGSYSNLYGALTPDNWLITPAINLTANANLTFWVSAQDPDYAAEHYGVYISTTAGTTPADFTLIYEETIDANGGSRAGTWKQKTVNLANYTGQTIRIAFRHFNCTDEFILNLDDVEITAQPTDPTIIATPTTLDFGTIAMGITSDYTVNITAYNLTAPVTATTTAPFAVSADGNTFGTTASIAAAGGTLYVQYAPTAVGTDNGTVTLSSTGATDVTITLSGSAIDCGNITIPFTEGFENGIDCWTMISMDPANDDDFGIYADADAYDGNFDFSFSSFYTASDYNQYLITPELTLDSTENYLVRFFYQGYNSSEAFKVLYSTTDNNLSSFTVLADYPTVATSWTEVILELPAGTKYVAINYYGNWQYNLYVDNFSIMTATASMSLSENALDFGINEMGSTSGAQYVVMNTINVNETFLLGTAAPFEISLDGVTFADTLFIPSGSAMVTYDTIFVRFAPTAAGTFNGNLTVISPSFNDTVALSGESMDCSTSVISTFPFVYDFNTGIYPPICWGYNDAENFWAASVDGVGDYAMGIEDIEMLVTPEINSTSDMALMFDYRGYLGYNYDNNPTSFRVGYSTTNNDASSFTWIETIEIDNYPEGDDIFFLYTHTIPANAKYVAINVTYLASLESMFGTYEDVIYIDNFKLITDANMFVTPESMSFGSIIAGAASSPMTANVTAALLTSNISVTAPANFEVSANGTSYAATATLPQTGGTLYVRYKPIAAGSHSGTITLTSGSINKTIAVSGSAVDCSAPQALPFFEDFEDELDECWAILDEDGDGYSWMNVGMEAYEGDGCYSSASYINDVGALTPDNWLISPALAIPSQGAVLSFYVVAQDASWAGEHYGVYVSTNGVNPNDFTLLYEEDLDADGGPREQGTWKQKTVNLPYGNQNINIAIRHFNCTDMDWMNIDNLQVVAGTGIENHEAYTKVYPNPAKNVVNIDANCNINRVEVYNMMGQMVGMYDVNDMNTQINTTNFANGVYTVRIDTENGMSTKKFTVAR